MGLRLAGQEVPRDLKNLEEKKLDREPCLPRLGPILYGLEALDYPQPYPKAKEKQMLAIQSQMSLYKSYDPAQTDTIIEKTLTYVQNSWYAILWRECWSCVVPK